MNSLNQIKNNFYKDGFVHVKKLFNKRNIQDIFNQINEIKNKSISIKNPNMHFTKDNKLNTIHDINTFIKSGSIINISKNKKLIKIVESILGEKAFVRNIEFFLKPKKTGMRSPFHQDNFYWNIQNKRALNVWIACSLANSKNGGVCYYKSSHRNGLIRHVLSGEPGSSQKISEKTLKKIDYKKVYPSLYPGDCMIHHCEVIHGSKKNTSNLDRIGLVISFKGKSAKINKQKLLNYRRLVNKNLRVLKKK